jgi:hypothetical protein
MREANRPVKHRSGAVHPCIDRVLRAGQPVDRRSAGSGVKSGRDVRPESAMQAGFIWNGECGIWTRTYSMRLNPFPALHCARPQRVEAVAPPLQHINSLS